MGPRGPRAQPASRCASRVQVDAGTLELVGSVGVQTEEAAKKERRPNRKSDGPMQRSVLES